MSLGGGTFISQNKVLPGSYINFVSAARLKASLSDRGVATMPLELDWGLDGEVFTVTSEEIIKDCKKIFGYNYTDNKMGDIRDLFLNATVAHLYRLNSGGAKAANTYATAKYSGIRGNQLKVVIAANIDNPGKYDVELYLAQSLTDSQTVSTASELSDNDYVVWKKDATLAVTAGLSLAGGTNGEATGDSHSDYLAAIESYTFNCMGTKVKDSATKLLYTAFTKRMRDEVGVKFQCVLYNQAADYEGVINVKNNAEIIPWVIGAQAGCPVNATLTNAAYNGEAEVEASYTQTELKKAIENGEFTIHKVDNEFRVLKDMNSLVTELENKNELFKSNQTIRVIDQIAMDIAALFNKKYLGKIKNNDSGRISLKNDIAKHHEELQKLGAIENFSGGDIEVSKGDSKTSVVVEDVITVVNAIEQLYMTVTIE